LQASSAEDAKYGFGRLIDLAPVARIAAAEHGRPVVVVIAAADFERLNAYDPTAGQPHPTERKTTTTNEC
jgi:hypothetical protein